VKKWELIGITAGPYTVTDGDRHFFSFDEANARWLVNVLDTWQREYERKHEVLNQITKIAQQARQCGAVGVDDDGHCKRCGLVPEEDTECPPGFF
jgi:hypothetical protein